MIRIATSPGARGFLVTLMSGILLVAVLPTPAVAVTCSGGANGYFILQDIFHANQYGVRAANVLVPDPESPNCPIHRTLYVWDSGINFVEVGWYRNGPDAQLAKCDDVRTPHVLVYAKVDGFRKCKPNTPELAVGNTYSFRVDNPDHDNDFVYYWDSDDTPSISLGYFATDHINGITRASTERHYSGDTLRARFAGVNQMGSGGGWGPFDNALIDSAGTSGYAICNWSHSSLVVKATGSC